MLLLYFLILDPFQGIEEKADIFTEFLTGNFSYSVMVIAIVFVGVMLALRRIEWHVALAVLLGGFIISSAAEIASWVIGV